MIYKLLILNILYFNNIKLSILSRENKIIRINKNIEKLTLLNRKLKEEKKRNSREKLALEKENSNRAFMTTSDLIIFINNICLDERLNLFLIGREQNLDEENLKKKIYIEIIGEEKSIYRLINKLEKTKMFLKFSKNNFTLEKIGNSLELKGEVMYIINNKKEKIKNFKKRGEIFKKRKERNIWGTRGGL